MKVRASIGDASISAGALIWNRGFSANVGIGSVLEVTDVSWAKLSLGSWCSCSRG